MFNKEDEQLMTESREAFKTLSQIQTQTNQSLYDDFKSKYNSIDKNRNLFEEYDELAWETKAKIDMLFYEQLTQKLDDSATDTANQLLINLFSTINEIYQFINLKPEVYAKSKTTDILSESVETVHRKLSKIIFEYLDRNFYSLSLKQRKDKYEDVIHEDASELIRKQIPAKEAISFATKTAVMDGLMRSIAFPFSAMSRLNYLMENESFRDMADIETLEKLKVNFDKYCHDASKIIATCV